MTTTYERYIKPGGLPPVEPLTLGLDTPDEPFFIRTHQVFEIWFAQIIAEIEYARARFSARPVPETDVPVVTHHLKRAAAIFGLLTAHLPVIETLLTTSFFDFRGQLFGASGV